MMAKKKKQQQPKVANSANINERKEKKERQDKKDKNKAKEVKNIVVEKPRIFQLDFKESFFSLKWGTSWNIFHILVFEDLFAKNSYQDKQPNASSN